MRFISLGLSNFQAHEDVTISLDNRIVVIRGATDVGKSAVLRALRWVCLNDIAGDEFIRHGAKRCEVALTICQNKKFYRIVRRRGAGDNEYEMDGNVYRAFGNTVPADIATLLNLNEINFQSQHDAPYWFSESAGEVSRQLNAIIDLNVIDSALSNVATEVRKANERKEVSEERLKEIKSEYEQLKPQQQRITDFDQLVESKDDWDKYQANFNTLLGLGNKIRASRDTVKNASERATDGGCLLQCAETYRQTDVDWTSLQELLEDIQHERTASIPPPDFISVSKAFETWCQLVEDCKGLETLVASLNRQVLTEYNLQNRRRRAEEDFTFKTKGRKCPTCGKLLP